MAGVVGTTLNNLPPVLALNGSELFFLYQYDPAISTWITYSCTAEQLFNGGFDGASVCSMRQLFAAMADQDVMLTAFDQLPADITNTYNIAWTHGYRMTITDPFITGFLQPAIGYSDAQMVALFALALTFPA